MGKSAKKMKNNSLPPVNEFADDEDTKEDLTRQHLLSNDEDEKTPSHNPHRSGSLSSSATMTFEDETFNEYVPATYTCTGSMDKGVDNPLFAEYTSSHAQLNSAD